MSRGGRRHGRPHLPVEGCHWLAAWGAFGYAQMWENDDGFAVEWTFDSDRAKVDFTRDGSRWSQSIPLTWAPCRYGGQRPWFQCPLCGRRAGKVYLPTAMYRAETGERTNAFRCRHCFDLTYEQRQTRDPYWPCLHRADRIAERWFAHVTEDTVRRRKGQHLDTFTRRLEKYDALIERANKAFLGCSGVAKIMTGQSMD